MFSASLRRNIGKGALDNLQEGLLYAFSGNIPGNGRAVGLPGYLIYFIDIDDTTTGKLHVVICRLEEIEDDVFHILSNISCFCKCGGICNGKRHVQYLGQGLGEKGLAAPGGTDEHDIALLQLYLVHCHVGFNTLVMIMDSH